MNTHPCIFVPSFLRPFAIIIRQPKELGDSKIETPHLRSNHSNRRGEESEQNVWFSPTPLFLILENTDSLRSGFAKYISFELRRRQGRSPGSVPAPPQNRFGGLIPVSCEYPPCSAVVAVRLLADSIRLPPSPAVLFGFAVGASIFLRPLMRGAFAAGGYPQTPAGGVPLRVAQMPSLLKRNAPLLRSFSPSLFLPVQLTFPSLTLSER